MNSSKDLMNFAIDIRINIIRQIAKRGFGHLGGSMSAADALSVLYGQELTCDPENPRMENRDYLVCSKGHAGPAVYAALALKGFFPMDWLDTLNEPGTNLPSHCDRKKTPGIDITTGSLGQGISVACGVALGFQFDGKENSIFCLLGDGESQEGQVWEAFLFAAQHKLSNLIVLLDYNKEQLDGSLEEITSLSDLTAKLKAFNFFVQEVNGHDHKAIGDAIRTAKAQDEMPNIIVLNTIKGKDCCFAEGKLNHHITVSEEEAKMGIEHLESLRKEVNR